MKLGLREQKQEVVRDALYAAAIELFAKKGFDETTLEEVAKTAGVSRRTFFRYFDSKDDLLSFPLVSFATILVDAVRSSPASHSPLQITQDAVLAGVRYTSEIEARTRQVIRISMHSTAARQAYQSRMMKAEDDLAQAYAARLNEPSPYELRPRLLAALTLTVINAGLLSWFQGQHQDLGEAAKDALKKIRSILNDESSRRTESADKAKKNTIRPGR